MTDINSRKGQAAMEFLMTYGWAILVVLAAIGALAYFGVLSPSQYLPESCVFGQGIACVDFVVGEDGMTLILQNGFGNDLWVNNITAEGCDTLIVEDELSNGEQYNAVLTGCSNGNKGDKYKGDVSIIYSFKTSNLMKEHTGSIIAKVQ